jgi:hypothetical protein
MLGGSETFAMGGWDGYPALRDLLPIDLKVKNAKFAPDPVQVQFAAPANVVKLYPFLQIDADPQRNSELWNKHFEPLLGLAPLGEKVAGSTPLLKGDADQPVMLATQKGQGRVVVFAGDSTSDSWLRSAEAARGFTQFWKQLVFWLAQHEDRDNRLLVKLDKRRLTTDPNDVLGFTVQLRDAKGNDLPRTEYTAKVVHRNNEYPVRITSAGKDARGSFQGAKEPGEYTLIVEGVAREANVEGKATARFLVAADDTETLRPRADHETLRRIASSGDGRFHLASEETFEQYLAELQDQVNRESRQKTTHWPDWNRLPASEQTRDQLSGMWNSFALAALLLFVMLLGCEWALRRWWGLV